MAVCDKTYKLLTDPKGPYAGQFIGIQPYQTIPLDDAQEYDCRRNAIRPARMTKGEDYHATKLLPGASDCCGPNTSCC